MRRFAVMLVATVIVAPMIIASRANAGAASVKPVGIVGHSIGETAAAFLSAEPEVQREADACRQQPDGTGCARLLAVLDGGQSGEISISGRRAVMFDGGRLARLTMPLDGAVDAATLELTKEFGPQSRNTVIPGQNTHGAKWQNHLYSWDTHDASVTLYEDNDPALSGDRLLLVIESTSQRLEDTVSVKELRTESQSGDAAHNPKPVSSYNLAVETLQLPKN